MEVNREEIPRFFEKNLVTNFKLFDGHTAKLCLIQVQARKHDPTIKLHCCPLPAASGDGRSASL